VSGSGKGVLNIAKWGLSDGWRGEVVKMCDVLIKSHDWRSVVNEKERNGWEERRIGCVYQEEA
jgi:ABC-type dipeptide/oligopeptide/nickel transport system ATPase component